jgi:hypothetical protein
MRSLPWVLVAVCILTIASGSLASASPVIGTLCERYSNTDAGNQTAFATAIVTNLVATSTANISEWAAWADAFTGSQAFDDTCNTTSPLFFNLVAFVGDVLGCMTIQPPVFNYVPEVGLPAFEALTDMVLISIRQVTPVLTPLDVSGQITPAFQRYQLCAINALCTDTLTCTLAVNAEPGCAMLYDMSTGDTQLNDWWPGDGNLDKHDLAHMQVGTFIMVFVLFFLAIFRACLWMCIKGCNMGHCFLIHGTMIGSPD